MSLRACIFLISMFAATSLQAELSKEECVQIERLFEKIPAECQSEDSQASGRQSGEPTGVAWENHVFFPAGGTNLDAEALKKLRILAQILSGKTLGNACLEVVGHSDSSGGLQANQRLGQLRAEKVAQFLSGQLDDASRIENIRSLGEEQPLTDRLPTDKWQRRVELRARHCLRV